MRVVSNVDLGQMYRYKHGHTYNTYIYISFLLHSNRQLAENRHVMCVVEKAGLEPRTLDPGAERATNCATAPVHT